MSASRAACAAPLLAACAAAASPTPSQITAASGSPHAPASVFVGGDVTLDVAVGEPMMLAGAPGTAFVKITLGGAAQTGQRRAPVNLSLVIDKSGSMAGDKLERAKDAAMMVLDRLQPDDTISVITYDSTVNVLVPSTKATDTGGIREDIDRMYARGSTALYDGVAAGLQEVGSAFDPKRVNRIILLSDGQANVGPQSPAELGQLGTTAAGQGITISTIGLGLGYNEDLMSELAMRSDGNHAFAETGEDLAGIFAHELGDVMSVVAQDVDIDVQFGDGIVPVRAIGRDAAIKDGAAHVTIGQLYAAQSKHVVFEVTVPAGTAGATLDLADVDVTYTSLVSEKPGTGRATVGVGFTTDATVVAAKEDKAVMASAVEAIATFNNDRAVAMRDAGNIAEARQLLEDNARYLAREGARLGSTSLVDYGVANSVDAQNLEDGAWARQRKSMRDTQYRNLQQRGW
jgi:Ca-activated chloride channel family protein